MKTVYLVRHGKALNKIADQSDFDRALTEIGKLDSLQVAERLKEKGAIPSLMMSSPAIRALETAYIFAKVFGLRQKNVRTRKALYDFDNGASFISLINELEDTVGNVMIFGHNPSMSDFASYLCGEFDTDIPTAGVVAIEFESESWKEISKDTGHLKFFDFPKPFKKAEIEKKIESKIIEHISGIFKELGFESAPKKIMVIVKRSAKNIACETAKKMKKIGKKQNA